MSGQLRDEKAMGKAEPVRSGDYVRWDPRLLAVMDAACACAAHSRSRREPTAAAAWPGATSLGSASSSRRQLSASSAHAAGAIGAPERADTIPPIQHSER